ncbi:MAG: FG-GAP-like repeat-containing protein [Bacteroidota bacterium]|nr:FG-GAP-like repeat-containing protein [Bacteroidota bacterium]
MKLNIKWPLCIAVLMTMGCREKENKVPEQLFESLTASYTQIDFENTLTYKIEFNLYKYRHYYNGGGVGLGDVNNDGLLDIYFTANLLPNRLYINKGGFVFEDVTEKAGVGGTRSWSTGVAMVDINADGWLDIYVCNSGDVEGDGKQNEFFINNGDGTVTERAQEMGLADTGLSTHATFFDYDKDGDLDMYLLNNSYRAIGSFNLRINERPIRDEEGGDKLFRNDGGVFTDVSTEAGIYGSEIGFGLGVSVADLDKDGWMDLYVCNDFFEKDYIYMNNHDGTFREELESQMRSISVASMGSDIADLNGDGYPEVFVTEMLPEGDERFKTTMTFEDWDKYQHNVRNGYYHQFTRNMLHKHNGVKKDGTISFSEVGRLLDVEATDWSWSALITDLDNDGFKDLYIANGLAQDILDKDYLNYIANDEITRMIVSKKGVDYKQLIDIIPVNRIPNYVYAGGEGFQFKKKTNEWGLGEPSHSNGAAYGDLDNDGDMDLIVNNVNMPPFVYRNLENEKKQKNHFLKVELKGEKENTMAVGAKVTALANGKIFYLEQFINRGFQSSVDPRLHFGLGNLSQVDTLLVEWYYGKQTVLTNIQADQNLVLYEKDATEGSLNRLVDEKEVWFKQEPNNRGLDFVHKENAFVDFDRDRLLYHMKSTEGPKIAIGDVNGDGLDDIHIGGAKDSPGKLYVQTKNKEFKSTNEALFESDKSSEDTNSAFFDADGDGDLDLYVTSGGNEFSVNSFALVDRLYLNDGKGTFKKSHQVLPTGKPESTSVVKPADFDGDGDLDLFVGVRLRPGLIGVPQNGYLLENDGKGLFKNVTDQIAPQLKDLGMITDAVWSDYDADGDDDLWVVGEWMPIKVFNNNNGNFKDVSDEFGLSNTGGWWNRIISSDLDNDGDLDFVLGNHGLNSRFKASEKEPITCYINDFDQNGSVEQLVCMYNEGVSYPQVLRHDLVTQIPELKKKFLKYESYKNKTINDVFTKEQLEGSIVHQVTTMESVVLRNNGKNGFAKEPLPMEAQLSPVYAINVEDFDGDGLKDIVMGGNLYNVKPEVGRYDASYGTLLKAGPEGEYKALSNNGSGLFLDGEVRDIKLIEIDGDKLLVIGKNNGPLQLFGWENQRTKD